MTSDSTTVRPTTGRRAATALLALGLAATLVSGSLAAGSPAGASPTGAAVRPVDGTAAAARYVLPTGPLDGAATRADLARSGALVRDFAAPTVRWGPGHRGVDLRTTSEGPVLAPQAGTVAFVGVVVDRPLVVLAHADGLRSTLEPVSSELSVGSVVGRGEVVGTVTPGAATHCAPSTCLHWGVRRGEEYVDPLALVVAREAIVLLPLTG